MLTVMVVINFAGCGEAQQRPAKLNQKISGEVIEMTDLSDITQAERQDSPENVAFKRQLISKIEDADKRDQANLLLAQNRLVYMFMEGKVVVLEFIPATSNKHAAAVSSTVEISNTASAAITALTTNSASAAIEAGVDETVIEVKTLHTFDSLMALKEGRDSEIQSIKVSTWSQNHFSILTEIAVQTGILENEKTDYNEKKSTLALTETPLAQAQVLILKSEIKTTNKTTTDAIGAVQQ
jgi:hypothetical protein